MLFSLHTPVINVPVARPNHSLVIHVVFTAVMLHFTAILPGLSQESNCKTVIAKSREALIASACDYALREHQAVKRLMQSARLL